MRHNVINKKNCLIYCRVSSAKQAQQGDSIEAQENICRSVAKDMGMNVLHVFKEQFSGRKDDRPTIEEIFAYIAGMKKAGIKVDTLLVRAIDRFTRNGTAGYDKLKTEFANVGVNLVDTYGIIQPSTNTLEHYGFEYSWSKTSPSEITELVMAQQGKHEVSQILTRMIGAEISLVQEGYKIRRADDGYMNKRVYVNGKKRVIQVPDPERAHFYVKMFELRAGGSHTDEQIVEHINAMGFRSVTFKQWSKDKQDIVGEKGANPLSVKQLQKLIKRTIYCGVNNEKWLKGNALKTQYEGLVSIEMFNRANRGKVYVQQEKDGDVKVLHDHNMSQLRRMKDNPLFPFKQVILCPLCGKPFLASSPKGKSGKRFPTYHCSRNHSYIGIRKDELENQLKKVVEQITYKDERFVKSFEATLKNKFREREKELGEFAVQAGATVSELEAQKQQLIKTYVATKNEIIRESLDAEINKVHEQIQKAQSQRNTLEVAENDIHSFVRYAKDLMEHPEKYLVNQKDSLKLRSLYGLVFETLPTYNDILNGTPKMSLPFRLSKEFRDKKSPVVTLQGIAPCFHP